MRTESNAEKDLTVYMIPPVTPRSPWRVAEVTPYPGYRLNVRFLDGLQGWVGDGVDCEIAASWQHQSHPHPNLPIEGEENACF